MRKCLLPTLIIITVIVVIAGCKKASKSTDKYFQGTFSINIPSYLLVSQTLDISLNINFTEPLSDISYEFSMPDFSIEAVTNSDGIITGIVTPSTWGEYTVSVLATHPVYKSLSSAKQVNVIDLSSQKSYSGYTNGENFIIDSRDNVQYYYTNIGNLDWFTSNLRWKGAGQSVDSVDVFDYIYGRLYTWEEATVVGVCPSGWSVPTNNDWEDFATALAGTPHTFDGVWTELGDRASAEVIVNNERLWYIYSPDNRHNNTHKWNGVPAGSFSRITTDPGNATDIYYFLNSGRSGLWWSATESSSDMAYYRHIDDQNADFPSEIGSKKYLGASVRCVRIHP